MLSSIRVARPSTVPRNARRPSGVCSAVSSTTRVGVAHRRSVGGLEQAVGWGAGRSARCRRAVVVGAAADEVKGDNTPPARTLTLPQVGASARLTLWQRRAPCSLPIRDSARRCCVPITTPIHANAPLAPRARPSGEMTCHPSDVDTGCGRYSRRRDATHVALEGWQIAAKAQQARTAGAGLGLLPSALCWCLSRSRQCASATPAHHRASMDRTHTVRCGGGVSLSLIVAGRQGDSSAGAGGANPRHG